MCHKVDCRFFGINTIHISKCLRTPSLTLTKLDLKCYHFFDDKKMNFLKIHALNQLMQKM